MNRRQAISIAGGCRLAVVLLAALLAGCAARVEPPVVTPSIPAPKPWTSAIGKLEIANAEPCTAILVAPTVILTASHCLHQNTTPTSPADLRFRPNFGSEPELPTASGVGLRAQGGAIPEGHLSSPEQVAADWALVDIAPAVLGATPIPLAKLTTDEIIAQIAAGDRLFTAGYGYGGMRALKQHGRCEILPPKGVSPIYEDGIIITNCIIRVGDSGGPVILLDAAGKPRLVGIFAGFGLKAQLGLSYAVNADRVAPHLGSGLVSLLLPVPGFLQEPFPQ